MYPRYDRTKPGGLDAPVRRNSKEMPIQSQLVRTEKPPLPTDGRLDKKVGQLAGSAALNSEITTSSGEVNFDGYL